MGEQPPAPTNVSILPTAAGAIYTPIHVRRTVKIYPIQEHELTTLNMFSSAVTVCASIVSGTAMYLLGIIWDMSATEDALVQKVGAKALFVGGFVILVCVVIGIWAFISKKSELKKILEESETST